MKHKHSEVIKAFVDGIECEYYYLGKIDAVWLPIINLRDFDFATDVRIKPESQQEQEPHIKNYEKVLKAYRELVAAQDKKIVELATELTYANQTIENHYYEEPIKEQEPQYQEPQFFHVYRHIDTSKTKMCTTLMQDTSDWDYLGKVRVEQ